MLVIALFVKMPIKLCKHKERAATVEVERYSGVKNVVRSLFLKCTDVSVMFTSAGEQLIDVVHTTIKAVVSDFWPLEGRNKLTDTQL